MARSAAVSDHDPRAALLDARLKAWFAALAAQPIPADLMRQLDGLVRLTVNGAGRGPETR